MSNVEKRCHPRIGGCCPICRLPFRECSCGEGRTIEIGDRDQAFKRLERELAEEKRLHEKTQDELGRVLLNLNEAEAQAAAMREALTRLSNEVLGSIPLMEPLARREFGNTNYSMLMQRAEEARALIFSLDAGAKMLRVVEAAKLVNRIALESGNSESAAFWKAVAEMREALAALGK